MRHFQPQILSVRSLSSKHSGLPTRGRGGKAVNNLLSLPKEERKKSFINCSASKEKSYHPSWAGPSWTGQTDRSILPTPKNFPHTEKMRELRLDGGRSARGKSEGPSRHNGLLSLSLLQYSTAAQPQTRRVRERRDRQRRKKKKKRRGEKRATTSLSRSDSFVGAEHDSP